MKGGYAIQYILMSPQELELVKQAKQGNKESFGEIYKLYLDRIYRFVLYLVYDEPVAQDLTQETFIKAWNFLPKFKIGVGTLQSFLYTVARNLVLDHQRKKPNLSLDNEAGEAIPDRTNIEEQILTVETENSIALALKNLPEFDRQIVILRFFEDLPFKEVARILKKDEGALRVRLHRALQTLKIYLKETK